MLELVFYLHVHIISPYQYPDLHPKPPLCHLRWSCSGCLSCCLTLSLVSLLACCFHLCCTHWLPVLITCVFFTIYYISGIPIYDGIGDCLVLLTSGTTRILSITYLWMTAQSICGFLDLSVWYLIQNWRVQVHSTITFELSLTYSVIHRLMSFCQCRQDISSLTGSLSQHFCHQQSKC